MKNLVGPCIAAVIVAAGIYGGKLAEIEAGTFGFSVFVFNLVVLSFLVGYLDGKTLSR